ncbi:sigma-54 interaction domain-containing protein [Terriglobus roseus]|uniref:DNA-binding transcriptional response regulator, NtrC family, contains REC, AAA-type ATPase, and a Fis-type DNA-binding domains n=1 Tax=Terriglobus roseus TaxID=392734 RepID=A0A1G7L9V7_9BACT|nr:sigma-54 dependent transcriptional regulator [Terriglobus roseus]SDF46233.1 DNA-binding transcriptional response regulator, NtrC family, contains REC, AAA-type ATPase, and a Fis-type DNA-binding domains [Terriglobus roseus]
MPKSRTVAIVSSSTPFLHTLVAALTFEGHEAVTFGALPHAVKYAVNETPDAVVVDVSSRPPCDEASLSKLVRTVGRDRVWMALPMGMSPWKEDAERLGIDQFLKTPIQPSEVEEILTDLQGLPQVLTSARGEMPCGAKSRYFHIEDMPNNRYFLTASPAMWRIYENVCLLAAVNVPVLILGESGVGKDVIANLLHKRSRRAAHPFCSVNCAALPSDLLESELFGYEAGAFTGAVKAKPGKFEQADKGTILLDEIGEMSAPMQAKLLHVLQDGRYSRLGARSVSQADVRVIAATNVNIEDAIADKLFREDLYYRINAFTIEVPPLRERREEIPYLVEEMMKRQSAVLNQEPVYISPRMMTVLQEYQWPGNLRELGNAVTRMQVLKGHESSLADIESKMVGRTSGVHACAVDTQERTNNVNEMRSIVRNFRDQTESRLIQQALEEARWNRRQAAVALRISYRALLYKIDQYRLKDTRISVRVGATQNRLTAQA